MIQKQILKIKTQIKNMSHTKQFQNQMQITLNKVCKMVGITPADYYKQQVQLATDWLMHELSNDTIAVDEVMQTTVFWSWWYLHAYHRSNIFIDSYHLVANPQQYYFDIHSVHNLCSRHTKHGNLLYNAYANIQWKDTEYINATTVLVDNTGELKYL